MPANSFLAPTSPLAMYLPLENQFSITIIKGTDLTYNPNLIYNFLNYHHLSSLYYAFISFLSIFFVPMNIKETLLFPRWHQAMVDEMTTLYANDTWDFVPLALCKDLHYKSRSSWSS